MVKTSLEGDGKILYCEHSGLIVMAVKLGGVFKEDEAESICSGVERLAEKLDEVLAREWKPWSDISIFKTVTIMR